MNFPLSQTAYAILADSEEKYFFQSLLVTSKAALAIEERKFRPKHCLHVAGIHLSLQEECQQYLSRAPLPGSGTTLSSKTSAPWKGSVTKSDLKRERN